MGYIGVGIYTKKHKLKTRHLIIIGAAMGLCSCTSIGNPKVAVVAKSMVGEPFKPGKSKQCAYFAKEVLKKANVPEVAKVNGSAQSFKKIGKPVTKPLLKNGDILLFTGTYNGPNPITHVGFYYDDHVIHRSTSRRPQVLMEPFSGSRLEKHFYQARRL